MRHALGGRMVSMVTIDIKCFKFLLQPDVLALSFVKFCGAVLEGTNDGI